ncbi:MAG: hypothetical protein WD740_01500 [Anaerolineales bacterium]
MPAYIVVLADLFNLGITNAPPSFGRADQHQPQRAAKQQRVFSRMNMLACPRMAMGMCGVFLTVLIGRRYYRFFKVA